MIFVDTGHIWALIDKRDQLHLRAIKWHSAIAEDLLVTEYVLWEVLNGFSAGEDRPRAHAAIDSIRSIPQWKIIAAMPQWFEAGLLMHRELQDKDWSLPTAYPLS